jgi:hypothetical protein
MEVTGLDCDGGRRAILDIKAMAWTSLGTAGGAAPGRALVSHSRSSSAGLPQDLGQPPWAAGLVEAQPGEEEFDHAPGVVPGVLVRADAEVADAVHQFERVDVGADLACPGGGGEQFGADGHEAVDEIGVQGREGGGVGLQCLGEAVLGDQEVDEQVDPPRQGGVRRVAVRQRGRAGLGARLDLVPLS